MYMVMDLHKSLLSYVDESSNPEVEKNVKGGMSRFLETVYNMEKPPRRTPEYYRELDDLSLRYLDEIRDHVSDLTLYIRIMTKAGYAPYTIRRAVSIIKVWYDWNNIVIPPHKYRTLIKPKLPKARAVAKKEKDITREDINLFFDMLPLDRQCILLVLISSGMRVGEATAIILEDINWNCKPVEIHIRAEISKTKTERYTFISSEAVRLLQSWLLVREDWVKKTAKYGTSMGCVKQIHDDRVFPLHKGNVSRSFRRYLKIAGLLELDKKTGRSTIIPHLFRGIFISQLQAAGMPGPVANMLAGHVAPYQGAYDIYSKDQIREMYLGAEYAVSLSSSVDPKEMQDIRKAYGMVISENQNLKQNFKEIAREMMHEWLEGKGVTDAIKELNHLK